MKTTRNEHIIKQKLQEVDLPDIDSSWEAMEKQLDKLPPATTGVSAFIGKYKIYLNILLVTLGLGVIGVSVWSTTRSSNQSDISDSHIPESRSSYAHFATSFESSYDHQNDLPIPSALNIDEVEPEYIKAVKKAQQPKPQKAIKPENPTTSLDSANQNNLPPVDEGNEDSFRRLTRIVVPPADIIGHKSIDFDLPKRRRNQVGIRTNISIIPEFSGGNAFRNMGYGVFARHYVLPKVAVELGLEHNPVVVRPFTHIQEKTLFNNASYSQRDSMNIEAIRYVTIPLMLHIEQGEGWSISVGPQFSFLSGLKGDVYSTYNFPGASEDIGDKQNTRISNTDIANPMDIGLNLNLSYSVKPSLELGLRVQQGLTDYSRSTTRNTIQTLQFKAAWILE